MLKRRISSLILGLSFIALSFSGCDVGKKDITTSESEKTKSITQSDITKKSDPRLSAVLPTNDQELKEKNEENDKIINVDTIKEFNKYLKSLSIEDLNSIRAAMKKCKFYQSSDNKVNDELIRSFRAYFNSVRTKYEDYFMQENSDIEIKMFNSNGLIIIDGEAGPFVHEDPNFIYNNFFQYASVEMKDFLKIRSDFMKDLGGGYLFEDALLVISWNQLSDYIVKWENFISRYQSYQMEITEAKTEINFLLWTYLGDPTRMTFQDMSDDAISNELEKSYIRFNKRYPNSKYQPIIKQYYKILKKNGFSLDNEAREYLLKNGIDVEGQEDLEIDFEVDNNKVDPIKDNDLQISKYKLDMTLEDFEKVMPNDLKEKISSYEDALEMQQVIYLFKDGTEFVFTDNTLYSITTMNAEYQTPRGLKVGDSATKLIELYGNPQHIYNDCWGYNYEGAEDYTVFYLTVYNEKVSKIEMSMVM